MDRIDADFLRWRTSGDLDALGAVYDAAAPGLLRMALHHVRHPAMAEDLVQTTFLAAIHNAARYDASRPLLGWLAGILANHAKWQQRREGRAIDATRLHAAEPADPLALAAASEFTAQCDAAIETLPELYRPVLRLSLKHELQAAEIAHVLGRPAGTVRSQLTRGLELLRAALPAGVALAAFAALLPARGLLAVRAEVLGAAKSAATAAVATTTAAAVVTGTSLWIGGVAMKKVVVGLAVVLLVGWWMLPPFGANDAVPREANAAGVVAASAPAPSRGDVTSPTVVPDRVVERAAGTAPVEWELTGRVVDADGAPAVGARVHVRLDFGGDEESLPPVTADNEGRYRVDLARLRAMPPIDRTRSRVLLAATAPGHAAGDADVELPHRDPERALRATADFELAFACVVVGRVLGRDERPVDEARVELHGEDGGLVGARYSDADGVFRIEAAKEGAGVLQITHLAHGAAAVPCRWKERVDTSVGDVVLRGDELMARVVFDNGEPAAGVELLVATDANDTGFLISVTTDAQGWLRVVPTAPTVHRVFARASDEALHCDLVPGAAPPTFVLEGLRLLRFSCFDAEDRPLHALDVAYSVWKPTDEVLARPPRIGAPLPSEPPAAHGAGYAPALLLPVGSFVHVAAHSGDVGAEVVVQAPPAPNVVDTRLVLRPRTADAGVRLVLSASDGGDVGAFRVHLDPLRLGDPEEYEFAMQRRDGAFEGWWHAGRYRVHVVPDGRLEEQWFARQALDVELVAGRTTEVPVAAPIGGRLRVRFHLPPGRSGPVRGWSIDGPALETRGAADRRTMLEATGDGCRTLRDEVPSDVPLTWAPILLPGRHEVRITAEGYADLTIGVDIRPRAVTDVDVHLQPR